MKSVAEIEATIQNLKDTIKSLESDLLQAKDHESAMEHGDVRAVAIALHGALCTSNHTDQCGWFYGVKNGVHNWDEWTHKHYVEKAEKFIEKYGTDNISMKIQMFVDMKRL